MRIALCLYGRSAVLDSRGIKIDWRIAANSYKSHIMECGDDVDVFIHTWSVDEKEKLTSFYEPKKIVVENSIFPNYHHPLENLKAKGSGGYDIQTKIQATYSRWDSEQKAMQLKRSYEKEEQFRYDYVISCRFDLLFYRSFPFHLFEKDKFYVSNWHYNWTQDSRWFGYPDAWFVGGSEIMDLHASVFDHLGEYLEEGGEFEKFIVEKVKEPKETRISSHAISRWHPIKMGYIQQERFFGLEYETWNLARRLQVRKNAHWSCPWDVHKPFNPWPLC